MGVLGRPAFRRLWLAEAISRGGDWFTLLALSVAMAHGSRRAGLAVSGLLLTQLLPTALAGPWSGVLADRFDRRLLLIASDLARVVIVLLMIPAVAAGSLPSLYLLSLAHYAVATVFDPARSALVPRLVAPSELVAAATISGVTWSVMAAIGGVLGGTAVATVGPRGAFLIDAATFLASALLIASIRVPQASDASSTREARPRARFAEGLRFLRANPVIAASLAGKCIMGVALADAFLILYGTKVFVRGEGGAVSVGVLWACFGLGAALGPPLLNLANDGSLPRLRRLIVVGSGLISLGMFLLAAAPSLTMAGLAAVARGAGGASNWTYTTVILQKSVPDALLGRVFALEMALLTLVASASTLAGGLATDLLGVRTALTIVAFVSLAPLATWAAALPWMDRAGVRPNQ